MEKEYLESRIRSLELELDIEPDDLSDCDIDQLETYYYDNLLPVFERKFL